MSEKLPVLTARTANSLPGGRLIGDSLPPAEKAELAALRDEILATGEDMGKGGEAWFRRQFADPAIIRGFREAEQRTGIRPVEFALNSLWFSRLDRWSITTGRAAIPKGPENVHPDGTPRRHEEGWVIDLDKVQEQGVDPAKVLYYRVTQPGGPKPEYFWTSDSLEVRGDLTTELGARQASTAIILASTLETIAQNGGLIEDINDDQGISVRQIGLGPFDQAEALFSFSR